MVEMASLEMYGQAVGGRSLKDRLHQAANGANKASPTHQAAISTDPGFYAQALAINREGCRKNLAREVKRNNILGNALYTHGYLPKGEEWPKMVKLLLWRDTPPCECCGWELEDYMEELTAGLNPREAVLTRALMGLGAERGQWLEVE